MNTPLPTRLRSQHKSILILARSGTKDLLRISLEADPHHDWVSTAAESFEQARYLLQADPDRILLIDVDALLHEKREDMEWLIGDQRPILMLVDEEAPPHLERAFDLGASHWLTRRAAYTYPKLLGKALSKVVVFSEMLRQAHRRKEEIDLRQQQIDRLLQLIWRISPIEKGRHWFSQRHMMERLSEEVARTRRHGGPLSLIIGEVDEQITEQPAAYTDLFAQLVGENKRCTDLVGQYGLKGFLLLLPQTSDNGASAAINRLRVRLGQTFPAPNLPQELRVHFGHASFSSIHCSGKTLLRLAEQRLSSEKAVAPDADPPVSPSDSSPS